MGITSLPYIGGFEWGPETTQIIGGGAFIVNIDLSN